MSEDMQDRWHRAVCKELEARVKGRLFLVWVKAEPGQAGPEVAGTPEEVDPEAWEAVAKSAEEWLGGLNQASVDPDDPPKHEMRVADVRIELGAVPKKTKRQGAGPLIGNPYQGVVTFTESYSAGPAEPFEDDA